MGFAEKVRSLVRKSRPSAGGQGEGLDPGILSPDRLSRVHRIGSLLSDLSEEENRQLVWGLVRRFARRVFDLPASEAGHHGRPWGLLDHSLEVAEYALRGSIGATFLRSVAEPPETLEFRRPRLRYASFAFGLLHDVGQMLVPRIRRGAERWNPFAEDLADFTARGEPPLLVWSPAPDGTPGAAPAASLLGRLLTPGIARYLTGGILGELLERESPAARRVFEWIAQADRRSVREDRLRRARESEEPVFDPPPQAYPTENEAWTDLLGRAFAEGIQGSVFQLNVLGGDLWVGKEYLALRYPAGGAKLATLVEKHLRPGSRPLGRSPGGEASARDLAHQLARRALVYRDPGTGLWKVDLSVALGEREEVIPAFLVKRTFPIPGEGGGPEPELFRGELSFSSPVDGWEGGLPGRRPGARRRTETAAAGEKDAERKSGESRGAAQAAGFPAGSPEPEPKRPPPLGVPWGALDPELLLRDIRDALQDGVIPANEWHAQAYVIPEWTYLVIPNGLRKLYEAGVTSVDPSKYGRRFMEALGQLDCVRKRGAGPLITRIRLREGANTCCAVVFETRRLFRTREELSRVGYWTQSAITEDPGVGAPAGVPGDRGAHA
jgi:hypothetical protein